METVKTPLPHPDELLDFQGNLLELCNLTDQHI